MSGRLRDHRDGVVEDRHLVALDLIETALHSRRPAAPIRADEVLTGLPSSSHAGPHPPGCGSYPPAVDVHGLDADHVASSLSERGCLLVPGLIDDPILNELSDGIDRTFDAFDDWRSNPDDSEFGGWFRPFRPDVLEVHMTRPALRDGGGIFTADSPRLFARWRELIHSTGMYDVIADFLGEAPITSLTKCTLRRVEVGDGVEWHQDGAFLGIDSSAVNVWVSLSDTASSPGLDIVATRLDEIVATGTHGARYDWSVGEGLVAEIAEPTNVVTPHFSAGDALVFDGLLLHRTEQPKRAAPEVRYAIETWFFRPSRFPDHQKVPIAL